MSLRTAFIGIDKHADHNIRELAAARRDATALWALFGDTLPDSNPKLLVDSDADRASVERVLTDTLLSCSSEDTVILAFAGHGTRDHRLVVFDTDTTRLPETTVPMATLAEHFRRSPARAILCILDCCFSGKAPARVFEDSPIARGTEADILMEVAGKGRLLLAASSPTESALELSGHGLLTEALLRVFQAGEQRIELLGAMGEVLEQVRTAAARMGYTQTPVLYGQVDGGLVLPRLQPGPKFAAAFPESNAMRVGSAFEDLADFKIPEQVWMEWKSRFHGGLNTLQLEAVNEKRVLDGRSVVVVAPTSSGKTFVGEMATVRTYMAGQKSVFLLPYRALVNEKYEQFEALYGQALGLRVIRSTGDFLDENRRFVAGQYDLAVMTYEMFLRLAVSSPHVLNQLGLVVLDEAQFITDPSRGIVVELLLTLLLSARDRDIRPQIIALSAVIGDANGFHEWLGSELLITSDRPVPLREGVLDRNGLFEYVDESGDHRTDRLLESSAVQQRRDKPSAQDVIVPLVKKLVSEGQKVIVFRNRKGPAEGCAEYLARDLGLPAATEVAAQLPSQDLSGASERLRRCLMGGSAFHNTNLRREERMVIERAFRDPDSPLRILAATTTLAAGINTPASTVILAEQEFVGEDGRPFTVAEYKNMAGRAGRLGFNENGTAIILTDAGHPRSLLFHRYVAAVPEALRSSFADGEVTTWILRLLTHVHDVPHSNVVGMLSRTYGGYCKTRDDPQWGARVRPEIERFLQTMLGLGLLEEEGGRVRLTLLGQACGRSALSFESAMRLVGLLRRRQNVSAEGLVALVQALSEADAVYMPITRGRGEPQWIAQAALDFGDDVVRDLQTQARDNRAYQGRCKRAALLRRWIAGTPVLDIEQAFSANPFTTVSYGTIMACADGTRFWLGSAIEILQLILVGQGPDVTEVDNILRRLELGIPVEALPLTTLPVLLDRAQYLTLVAAGATSPEDVRGMSLEKLSEIVGHSRAREIKESLPATGQ